MSLQGLRREIHGFEPGSVVAATELVMSHVHPEDADSARESQEAVLERSEAFSPTRRVRRSAPRR